MSYDTDYSHTHSFNLCHTTHQGEKLRWCKSANLQGTKKQALAPDLIHKKSYSISRDETKVTVITLPQSPAR